LQFLAKHEGADSEQHDRESLRTGMRKVANQMIAGLLGLEKARQRFNDLLKGHLQIEWIGTWSHQGEELQNSTSTLRQGGMVCDGPEERPIGCRGSSITSPGPPLRQEKQLNGGPTITSSILTPFSSCTALKGILMPPASRQSENISTLSAGLP